MDEITMAGRLVVLAYRASRGWTQAEAAAWWGCSERTWRRYEKGTSRVPKPLLKRIGRSNGLLAAAW